MGTPISRICLSPTNMLALIGITGFVAVFSGCDASTSPADGSRPIVVTTTTMIDDLARQIGGDRVRVVGIMPSGMNPHTYDPTPDDSVLFRKADLILYNGLHLEGRLADMFADSREKAVPLAEDPRIKTRGSQQYNGASDPHCWWNPQFFAVYADRARDALTRLDPDGATYYAERTAAFQDELAVLTERIHQAVDKIPPDQRYLITSHDAFYYYGDAFGLTVDAVLGISTDASVRPLRIEELARVVVQNQVPAIFHETAVSSSLNEMVNRVVERASEEGHTVVVADQPLYSDSLGERGTPAGSYLGALRENTRIIVNALTGEDVGPLLESKDAGNEQN